MRTLKPQVNFEVKEKPYLLALFPVSDSVNEFNSYINVMFKIQTHTIEAIDSNPNDKLQFKPTRFKRKVKRRAIKKASKTAGLEQTLKLGINSRVIMKRNTDVDRGLCNGALALVTGFRFDKLDSNKIVGVVVKFDRLQEEVVIGKISADYEYQKNIYVTRIQFPLGLSWALTIHKSQGLSLDAILIDLGKNIFEGGQAYVSLSLARTFDGIFLCDFYFFI